MKQVQWYVLLLMSTFLIFHIPATAQKGISFDSTIISKKNMPQQNEFWNNKYNFPAKPRNQIEIGASFGMLSISSDVPAKIPTFGFEAHIRKSFGYLFSLRLQYINGVAKGMMWQPSAVNTKNPAWLDNTTPGFKGNLPAGLGYNAAYRDNTGNIIPFSNTINNGVAQSVYHNYKTNMQDLSLQGLVSFNNIRFNKQKSNLSFYGGAGIGLSAYHVMVNAYNESQNKNYTTLFNNVLNTISVGNSADQSKRKNILKTLKEGMDNTYETVANGEGKRRSNLGKNTLRPTATVIIGLSYKLSKRINLAIEDRHTAVKSDLLDGQQWQVHPGGDVAQTRDYDSYNFLSIGLNFNLGGKSVEPLWWVNPLDYAYGELNNPKHIKFPKPVFEDTDEDGVIDQLDREPNTPAGCPVDTHGVTKDTDGDGVADCKDKQLITPTDCQPVDADGVGKCPELECCKAIANSINELKNNTTGKNRNNINNNCPTDYPSLTVKALRLSKDNMANLEAISKKLQDNPVCTITLTGYPKTSKSSQSATEKKIDLLKNYLVEKLGISAERISTNTVIEGGDENIIDVK